MSTLALALKMELDGEQYYLNQAEIHKGTSMYRAFFCWQRLKKAW